MERDGTATRGKGPRSEDRNPRASAAATPDSIVMLEAGAKLSDVVKALNALGATPQDLLAILQAMKASGALRAELEVI